MRSVGLGLGFLAVIASGSARAEVAMSGTFAVSHACAAYQSIRKGTNPGAVTVQPNKSYDVLAGNKPDATHYRIVVEGASPAERWVSAACGTLSASIGRPESPVRTPGATAAASDAGDTSGARATHVLAMSWEPAFCGKHMDKAECRALTATSFGGKHLSLHGLWPQPRGTQYCNVAADVRQLDRDHNWEGLPEPQMSAATLQRLAAVMPGVESKLQRHEWIVHGTCFGSTADSYFARAASLAEAIDTSKVRQLFAEHVGQTLSIEAIRAAFDDTFGQGAGARVAMSCAGRGEGRKITQLTINLAGDVTGTAGLGSLMRAAQVLPAGCPAGLVERAGS